MIIFLRYFFSRSLSIGFTSSHFIFLENNCTLMQGYYFSKILS